MKEAEFSRGLHRVYLGSVILGVLLAAVAANAFASTPRITVDSDGPARVWSGTVSTAGAPIWTVPECRKAACARVNVTVRLPVRTWVRNPGGVEISIRWSGASDDVLLLHVYRDGKRVAGSTALVAKAQSVVIPSARNGTYTVYVARADFSPSDSIAYEGLSEVEYKPARKPARALLPDLEARPQRNATFERPTFDLFEPAPPEGENCFPSEVAESGAENCLRFDQVLANRGEGALDLRFKREPGVLRNEAVSQRIYHSTGNHMERSAGDVEYHAVHGHYHFEGFAQSTLYVERPDGRRGTAAALGSKVSFCIADTDLDRWALKGNGGLTYAAPDCLEPYATDARYEYFFQGMSPGWADTYDWFLPGQYIEVSGVPDGRYILDTVVDPESLLVESDEANNCGAVRIQLTGMGTDEPQAKILGPGPPCVD